MDNKFYVTTPIYYVNDIPHIGHAYTTIAADILARYNRLQGKKVFFLTGTDEHGQKVQKAADEKGRSPQEHADLLVGNFKELWRALDVSHDAFIRTTDEAHIRTVQGLLQRLYEKNEIEKRTYAGWYCTPDERFWTEKDLVDGNCPDCGRPVEQIHEENYFFLMSKYQDWLIQHIEKKVKGGEPYVLPEARSNEVLGFLKNNELGDLCISRPKQRLSWGVPLPFDDNFVTYVWFDALVNYFSATRYLVPDAEKAKHGDFWWPASCHLVGKDILTTHAVYWSTMLKALELPLPKHIFAHGWWTVEGKKMSKSLGNVVDPHAMADTYGVDAFRYFLFREVPFGLDGDFSEEALINRINTDLANDLGNLQSRFLTMAEKFVDGFIEMPLGDTTELNPFARECTHAKLASRDDRNWSNLRFNIILEQIWEIVGAANNHIARTEPWKLAREDRTKLGEVMFNVWNALRLAALLLYPFMPGTAGNIWRQLGLKSLTDEATESLTQEQILYPKIYEWDWRPGYKVRVTKGEQLFPRIEKRTEGGREKPDKEVPPENSAGTTNLIAIGDVAKVELKTGKVIHAERVKGSNKLIRMQVDTGEQRQIVAGIGTAYSPEDLTGKMIVVVANLQPAKLMGIESQGMLLAATDSGGDPVLVVPEKDVAPGSKIK